MEWLRLLIATYVLPALIAAAVVVVGALANLGILRGLLRSQVDPFEIVVLSLGIVGPLLFAAVYLQAYFGLSLLRDRNGPWAVPFQVATLAAVLVFAVGTAWIWTKRV